MTRAGRLRHRVTIEQSTPVAAADGELIDSWTTVATVWAEVLELRGREYIAAREAHAEVTTKIKLRYIAGLTPKMRVIFGAHTYDIAHIVDLQGRTRDLELLCTEIIE